MPDDAKAVTAPSIAKADFKSGMVINCTHIEFGFLQYRLKSPILLAMVDHTPMDAVVAVMKAMKRGAPDGCRTL